MLAHPERDHEWCGLRAQQAPHGRHVEVVVMIVRDHDRVDLRERDQGQRDGMESAGADEVVRRQGACAPHRVGENSGSVDLKQH
jgi:hypothetical protein